MSWFADLAGKAENLLNNLDEQTGAALRNHNVGKQKRNEKNEFILHPDPVWGQKRRPISRNLKKISPIVENKSTYNAVRKISPMSHQTKAQVKESHDSVKDTLPRTKKSPVRKSSPHYNLNHCPRTLVGDVNDSDSAIDHFGLKQRRNSLPADLEIIRHEDLTYKMQNLEVENAMLKNELNVMNREVSDLLDRLRKTEDGNNVVNSHKELQKTNTQLDHSATQNSQLLADKESLSSQLEQLKRKIYNMTTYEMSRYRERSQELETEVTLLTDKNTELEDQIKRLTEKANETDLAHSKFEKELRHSQLTISELQSNLEKSTAECQRLEKDWESYKLRVKGMLFAKDNEIKALQEGVSQTGDTKILMEQLESLKEERDELSSVICRVRAERDDMKQYVERMESQSSTAERVVTALREALKEERGARNRAEAQCVAIAKELKTIQFETGQTIASLRTALRDKDNELNNLRDATSSTVRSADTSALNVADYDVTHDTVDTDKIHYLTQMLVQRQGKIETLLADNNMLKIQLDKLECKYKTETAALRANHTHSVVHLHEGEPRPRSRINKPAQSALSTLSLRLGVFIKRYPVFRIFIIVYMIGLHLWVLAVLFTRTPEDFITRHTKT